MPIERISPLPGTVGPAGPANSLTIGTVAKVAAGGEPSATITGTAPNQNLNLNLVSGADSTPSFYRHFLSGAS